MPKSPTVFLALPNYGNYPVEVVTSLLAPGRACTIIPCLNKSSMLCNNFSQLLCMALNYPTPLDWWLLLHADIHPEHGFVDTLVQEACAHGADVLSAVVPMKGPMGLTSTGLGRLSARQVKRLTMKEALQMPRTFGVSAFPDHNDRSYLGVNSGCMLWNMKKTFAREFMQQGGFHMEHWCEAKNGQLEAHVWTEDFHFSHWAGRRGLRVMATTAVRLGHVGPMSFGNDQPWGEWETDQSFPGYREGEIPG